MTRITIVTLLTLGALACSTEQRGPDQFPIGKSELTAPSDLPGAATYRRYCVSCHGADGRGNGGITGKDFVADRAALAARDDASLASSVREGKRGERAVMPAHKPVLKDPQIDEVIGYVRTRFLSDPGNAP